MDQDNICTDALLQIPFGGRTLTSGQPAGLVSETNCTRRYRVGEQVYIRDVGDHEGEEITIKGWLYNRTDKGRLQFLLLRDGTGMIQGVAFKKEIKPEAFAAATEITQESSVIATGTVRADARAAEKPKGNENQPGENSCNAHCLFILSLVFVFYDVDNSRQHPRYEPLKACVQHLLPCEHLYTISTPPSAGRPCLARPGLGPSLDSVHPRYQLRNVGQA